MSSRIVDCDVITDLMIHDIDLSIYFNGEIRDIYAHGVVINDMIEYARACFIHKNGSFSNLIASRITEKRLRQIAITTQNEYIDCNLLRKEVFVDKQSVEQRLDNVSISANTETIEVRGQEPLLSEIIDFVNLCKGNSNKNLPTELDGQRAMSVAHIIQEMIYRG